MDKFTIVKAHGYLYVFTSAQTYGYEHLVTLHNLEKVGLLRLQGTTRSYATIRKSLKLLMEEVNEQASLGLLCFNLDSDPRNVSIAMGGA